MATDATFPNDLIVEMCVCVCVSFSLLRHIFTLIYKIYLQSYYVALRYSSLLHLACYRRCQRHRSRQHVFMLIAYYLSRQRHAHVCARSQPHHFPSSSFNRLSILSQLSLSLFHSHSHSLLSFVPHSLIILIWKTIEVYKIFVCLRDSFIRATGQRERKQRALYFRIFLKRKSQYLVALCKYIIVIL